MPVSLLVSSELPAFRAWRAPLVQLEASSVSVKYGHHRGKSVDSAHVRGMHAPTTAALGPEARHP